MCCAGPPATDRLAGCALRRNRAGQMLRKLREGRLVFTPLSEAVEFTGQGDFGRIFNGLIDPQALASLTFVSWNQIREWIRRLEVLRRAS